jgi:hypothetical protein
LLIFTITELEDDFPGVDGVSLQSRLQIKEICEVQTNVYTKFWESEIQTMSSFSHKMMY